jgi:drug/metabolite transporter (DMT)-like permease
VPFNPSLFAVAMLQGIIWSSAFPMITLAGRGMPVFTIVALRLVVAALVLVLYRYWKTGKWGGYAAGALGPMLLLAVLGNNIPFVLITEGQKHITSGESALLIALVPTFNMLFAHFLLGDEKFNRQRLAGTALGFAGVLVLMWPHLAAARSGHLWAYVMVGLTALSYGGTHVMGKYYSRFSSLDRATASLSLAALLAVPLALLVDAPWQPASWPTESVLASIGLGILPSAIANLLFFHLVSTYGTALTGFAGYFVPVFGVCLGAFFFAEPLTVHVLGSLLLILTGMMVARA